MANEFPISLIETIISKLEGENIIGGKLEDVKTIDWGSIPPPIASSKFPMIFVTIGSSSHPEVRAAKGSENSYDDSVKVIIVVYSFIVKNGTKEAMVQASNIYKKVLEICHSNKTWDETCYTSEAAEEADSDWGMVPWGDAGDLAYGISLPLVCKRISQ